MPAAIAVPLIIGAAQTGAAVYSAKKGAKTAKDAAAMQAQEATRAADRSDEAMRMSMDFNQQQQRQMQESYAPYVSASRNALSKLSSGMGLSQPGGMSQPGMLPQGQLGMQMHGGGMNRPPMGNALARMPGMGGGTVRLQAPDGEIREFPRERAAALIERGAKVVQ